jgi:hypothetical protein
MLILSSKIVDHCRQNRKREKLSRITLDWIDYKVWDNYTIKDLRQFWLFWKNIVLEWIYKFTNEDWTDWYK